MAEIFALRPELIAKLQEQVQQLQQEERTPYDHDMSVSREELEAKLAAVRADVKADGATLRADLAELRSDIKGSVESLRADLHKMNSEQVTALATQSKWVVGLVFAGLTAAVSIMTFISNKDRQTATAVPQQPTVIVVPGGAAPTVSTAVTPQQPPASK